MATGLLFLTRPRKKNSISMITKVPAINVYVGDQDRALDFYVNKLGFTKLRDDPNGTDAGGSKCPLRVQNGDRFCTRGQASKTASARSPTSCSIATT